MKPARIAVWFAVTLGIAPAVARAEEPPLPRIPEQRINYDATIGGRINPIGVEAQYAIGYRHRLYASGERALRDNDVGVFASPTLSPAVVRLGGGVELRPFTMLTLQAGFHWVGYFGSFKSLQSYRTASADFSDTALAAGDDAQLNYPTHGLEAFTRAIALAKVGPIVIRDELMFVYSHLKLHQDDALFYNPRMDLLVGNDDWFLHNDSDVVYLTDFGLVAGVRAATTHAFYPDSVVGGSASEDNVPMFRLGPLAAFTIFDKPGASFNRPTFIAHAAWWLQHRYRTGEDVSQGIPYVILAFRCEGDLWRSAN